jgi:hypothetical protein
VNKTQNRQRHLIQSQTSEEEEEGEEEEEEEEEGEVEEEDEEEETKGLRGSKSGGLVRAALLGSRGDTAIQASRPGFRV